METLGQCIKFHECRIKSIENIVEKLNELNKSNLVTTKIDLELDMQLGELAFHTSTLEYLKQLDGFGGKKDLNFKLSGRDLISAINRSIFQSDRLNEK